MSITLVVRVTISGIVSDWPDDPLIQRGLTRQFPIGAVEALACVERL